MKKFLLLMLMMISMVTSVTLVTSCDNHHTRERRFSHKDSLAIAEIARQSISYETTDVNEFLVHIVAQREHAKADSIVFHLPDNILAGICNTLVHKGYTLSSERVADEYLSNRPFYDGMIQYSKFSTSTTIDKLEHYERPGDTIVVQSLEERRAE